MSLPRMIVPGRCYLITRRCTQRQFLLRPDKETTNAFLYCLAVAALRTGIVVIAATASSNHHHTVVLDPEGRLPEFLEYFHKYVAKHQNSLRGRWENFWSSEQTSVVHLCTPDDVLSKVIYTLSNPVKDHLVEKTHHWPGATTLAGTLAGTLIRAKRPRRFFRPDGPMPESVELTCARIPGFENLSDKEYRDLLAGGLEEVESAAAQYRRDTGKRLMGRKAVMAQNPLARPKTIPSRRSLNPRVAGRDPDVRLHALSQLRAFWQAYRETRSAWLRGDSAEFPAGTWWLRVFAAVPCQAWPSTA